MGAPAEAAQPDTNWLEVRQSLAALDPANGDWQHSVAVAQFQLGDCVFKAKDVTGADR